MLAAVNFFDGRIGPDIDVGRDVDLVDQILGHAGFQRTAPHQHGHLAGEAREEHGP